MRILQRDFMTALSGTVNMIGNKSLCSGPTSGVCLGLVEVTNFVVDLSYQYSGLDQTLRLKLPK